LCSHEQVSRQRQTAGFNKTVARSPAHQPFRGGTDLRWGAVAGAATYLLGGVLTAVVYSVLFGGIGGLLAEVV